MAKVFVSYSRKDIEFAKRLTGELKKSDLEFWVDWEGIPPTVDFMKQIEKGIEESDIFLFLISPDSAKSKVCGEEIAHAAKNGKRLIPLIVRDVKPDEEMPQAISHLNWIFFREQDNFEESFQKLLLGINTDFEWVDVHSRLLVRALEWEQGKKDISFLLRGRDLQDAETQLAINTSKDPHPTDLHREYILKSRQYADRQRRWITGLVAVAAVIMFALGIYGLREAKRANDNQQREEIAKNHALAKEVESEINQLSALAVAKIDQDFSEALLLGVEAYLHTKENKTNNFTAQGAMTKILQSNPGLIQVLLGHTDWVNVLAISPDRRILASGSWDSTVNLWDISNPASPLKLTTLREHTSSVEGVAFSSDGKTLASSSSDGLILWDTSDPSDPQVLGKRNGYYSDLKFIQDNKVLSSIKTVLDPNYMSSAVLLDVSDGKSPVELNQLDNGDKSAGARDIALSPDGNLLFSLLGNGNIHEWDITDPNESALLFTMEGTGDSMGSIALSADGKTLAVGSSDTTITLWDVTDPAAPVALSTWSGHSLPITSLAFSADGDTLASSSDETKASIILWDISDPTVPKKIRMLNGHSLTVTGLIFNRNDAILLSGSHDGTIMLWDVSKPKTDLEFGAIDFPEDEFATGMTFKPNSNLLTTGNSDGKLTIWDVSSLANPKKTKTLDGPINITVFSRDGNLMASSGDDNIVTLWDTTDFVELSTIKIDNKRVNAIELSTDGKTLAIIGEKIILWDITDPKKPVQLTTLPQQINEMADMVFNSDGKVMASITDKNIVLWDVSNPASPARVGVVLEGHTTTVNNFAFSPTNANLLASASSDRTVILWNITDPGSPQKINTLGNHSDWVNTVSISPDGTMLATGSDDKQVNLWNITNPEEPALISTMIGHSERVNTVRFGPQGGFIASLGDDNKIIFWDINPESWAQKACSIAGGDFTVIEWDQFFPSEDYRQTCKSFPSTLEVVVATLEPVPTVEQSAAPLPVCTSAQTPGCSPPSSKQLDEFCVDNNSYGLYNLPLYTTFEVLTPGFTCIDEKVNSLGEPRISCTGPTDEEFEVSFCNSSCSNTLEPSNQCEAGFGLNSAQGCCAPISDTSDGCVVEVLTLNGCE